MTFVVRIITFVVITKAKAKANAIVKIRTKVELRARERINLYQSEDKNFEKEFENIMDTVKYLDTLNIKLDRKTLNNRLKDGKIYKDFYFAY